MINTNERKLNILAWLNGKGRILSYSHLQIQKFMYFYEMFQYTDGLEVDLDSLKAYKNGPVFSKTYGDYNYEKEEFIEKISKTEFNPNEVNLDNLEKARFIIETMTDIELSDLTHKTDMWKSKENLLKEGIKHISIEKEDITEEDKEFIREIKNNIYIPEDISILSILDKRFIISNEDKQKLTEKHHNVLEQLSREDLINPVYIELDEDGVMLVD